MDNTELISHFGANLGIASLLVVVTATMHFIGLSIFTISLRAREWRQDTEKRPIWRRYFAILGVVIGLFVLHTMEIWTYAAVYRFGLKAFKDFEEALYFSTLSFVSLGFGDVLMPRAWRLVGAIEAVNGVVLLGWSTAFFITVVGRLRVLEHEWLDKFRPKHHKTNEENDEEIN